ncbi:MAG: argininosuccinate synthase, partial [Alphaproteobacteria bacterium]
MPTKDSVKGSVKDSGGLDKGVVVLAFSGGLDTSIILRWLQEERGLEVATFTADLGQGEEVEAARKTALSLGVRAEHIFIEDLRERFVSEYVFPMLRANARYEDVYLLGTSIARPLIARRMVEVARGLSARGLAHGCTGKGNDQVRFELTFASLAPDLEVIAPWREWEMEGRSDLVAYARAHGIEVAVRADGGASYSTDGNLLHISYEGGELEDPWCSVPESVWTLTASPKAAPAEGEELILGFREGDAVSIDSRDYSPADLLLRLNALGGRHGIGRLDMVESRATGMKSRGAYETPGGMIIHIARRGLEQITLDVEVMRLRDELMPRYAAMVYGGFWDSPERLALQALVDESSRVVSGEVRLFLYRGGVYVRGRRSDLSLYRADQASFEASQASQTSREEQGEQGEAGFCQSDAGGFIRLQGLRLAA